MAKVLIGALVGMGPNSTAPFYDAVMNYARTLYGAKNDIDFPEMVMISLPTPFVPGAALDDLKMISILTDAVQRLNRFGVNYIVIPCNVVHRYYDDMQQVSAVPILNIIDIAVNRLLENSSQTAPIALIGTRSTIDAGLYQQRLTEKGIKIFHTQELQRKVDGLLLELKRKNESELARACWYNLVKYLEKNCCAAGIIACTDISPLIDFYTENLMLIDSMDALAQATIEEFMRLRAEQHV